MDRDVHAPRAEQDGRCHPENGENRRVGQAASVQRMALQPYRLHEA
jgi:hypothetical protein